jgi:hypothetical protein
MRRVMLGVLGSAVVLAVFLAGEARAQEKGKKAGKSVLERRVDLAVQRSFAWMRKAQNRGKGKEGAWSFREPYWESGVTSLALFAMVKAGIDREDPMIQAGFRYIAKNVSAGARPTEMYTYNIATQMLAIEAAYGEMLRSRSPRNAMEKALLAIFEADFAFFKKALKNGEAGYTIDQQGLDISNTQFTVMALEAANRAGYICSREMWFDILKKGMELQAKDGPQVHRVNILSRKGDEVDRDGYIIRDRYSWLTGKPAKARGWTYGEFFKKDEIYGSMTCAGLANLLSCSLILEKEERFKREFLKDFRVAVRDGFAWLQKYYAVNANPAEPSFWSMGRIYKGDTFWTYYYLFTLARITKATNIRFIGNRNWYVEGCDFLLRAQQPAGCWDQVAHETHNFKSDCIPIVNTAFALWFFSSLDHVRLDDPEVEARTAREKGEAPENEGELVRRLERMLMDAHRPRIAWDVDSPFDGTADLLYGYAMHPVYAEARTTIKMKNAVNYLRTSLLLSQNNMNAALKTLKSPTTMGKYYGKYLLYERWRTATLGRMIRALVAHGMGKKDWTRLEKAKPGSRPKVASSAKKLVSALVRHMASHGKKVGRDKFGWAQSCGRPTVLQPDALNTVRALLAFNAASWCGVNQSSAVWKSAGKFLLAVQEENGPELTLLGPDGKPTEQKAHARGFGVLPGDPAELALTFDVLSALHLVLTFGKASAKFTVEIEDAIRDGLGWLQLNFHGYPDFELLVSAKRLGHIADRQFIGELDWHAEGLKFIGYQDKARGFLAADSSRRIAFTFFFLSPRFLF